MSAFLLLGLFALGAWFWYDSLRVRERAVRAARQHCALQGVQFLDDTVALSGLGLGRDLLGRLRIRRVYQFEFSASGDTRRQGLVLMLGDNFDTLRMGREEALH
ncbi:MAG: DUF3301 domain-containing protein [Pseudomonadota bacterium]